jgi:hypothetical protein
MFSMRLNWIPALLDSFLSFPSWLSGTIFAINFYNFHAQNLFTLFMLIQRLTAILRPFDFEKVFLPFISPNLGDIVIWGEG